MTDRAQQLAAFLTLAGWGNADRKPLAGDASNRRYVRLNHPELGRAVLMDAPPEKGEDTRPFIKIATHLRGIGLSAPQVIARDTQNGFLILEDLGDDLFAKVLAQDITLENQLYVAATDALYHAQNAQAPEGLMPYGPEEMAQTAMLAPDWYLRYTTSVSTDLRETFLETMRTLLTTHLTGPQVLVQRDYHAENLLWLPTRDAPANVGLLDFQDAMLGHPAYDLASLLKDARRDVGQEVQQACIARFQELCKPDPDAFAAAYAICSAQRNLRILGVFTRLCVRDGKRHYPDMLPRVWRNLISDLDHPALSNLREIVVQHFPEPDARIIAMIKAAHA